MTAVGPRPIRGFGLGPLVDDNGEAYRHVPCQSAPHLWDDEANAFDKAFAANACRTCPAIVACYERREYLGDAAVGVWAGEVLTPTDDDLYVPVLYDFELEQWAAAVGVTLRSPDAEEINSCPPAARDERDEKTTGSSTEPRSGTPSRAARRSSPRKKPGSSCGDSPSSDAGDRDGSAPTLGTASRKSRAS